MLKIGCSVAHGRGRPFVAVCSWIRMTATPVEDLVTKLRAAHPDLLRAACDGRDDADAVTACLASPELAEYFQLGRTDDDEVSVCSLQRPSGSCSGLSVGCLLSFSTQKQLTSQPCTNKVTVSAHGNITCT